VLFSVGFEAGHTMPLGLHAKPGSKALYDGISDATDINKVKQQVQALKDLGAVVSVVHSEEPDMSASTIDDGGFDAMEWYNIHASFSTLLGDDLLSADPENIENLSNLVEKLIALVSFMSSGSGSPHPDLVYLVFLDKMPEEGFAKWRSVQQSRPITGILGSDIHRNLRLDSDMCGGTLMQLVCSGALAAVETLLGVEIPSSLESAVLSGGSIDLADGDRVDSYARLMRWLENRVLVTQKDQLALQESLRAGRSYGLFSVFGEPNTFAFTADAGGATLQMGAAAAGPFALNIRLPDHPSAMGLGGASFTQGEAAQAELRVKLVRLDAAGATTVREEAASGVTMTEVVSQPGAYYVEVWIRPLHLTGVLGSESSLAQNEYLWIISNPIRLLP
jgi:hypothetical protein